MQSCGLFIENNSKICEFIYDTYEYRNMQIK